MILMILDQVILVLRNYFIFYSCFEFVFVFIFFILILVKLLVILLRVVKFFVPCKSMPI